MCLKMLSAKWPPFCSGGDELITLFSYNKGSTSYIKLQWNCSVETRRFSLKLCKLPVPCKLRHFADNVFHEPCRFYPSWQNTSIHLWQISKVVFLESFQCIYKRWMQHEGNGISEYIFFYNRLIIIKNAFHSTPILRNTIRCQYHVVQ